MKDLYPAIEPFTSQMLPVGNGHRLYVEQVGKPDGIPVLFLHGGPGAGCEPYHRRFFNPDHYRVVLFDQRGCGHSTPHASLEANTTWDLVGDIERIRQQLNIEQWLLFGGSWGSTLALAYAQSHPDRVTGMVLRGIFLCRDEEISWFYQHGASRVFPDYWEDFIAPIPQQERDDLLHAYHRRLSGENDIDRMAAAKAWSVWEGRTASLHPNPAVVSFFSDPHTALSLARIECHYFVNHAFLRPNQLLLESDRLADIPGVIVQGRYDLICPMTSAWELHRAWPGSELKVIGDAGHSAAEPGIRSALIEATDRFAKELP
ncbi:MAG: prolyl aminopeptidase [Candidatus Thiodiazotropha sp. (ex Lucina aurantia)]|uniref:Proline iminopeptidase n=2 Tax=Candidatus Thiodiazotropha TaxID=1913444 RepID=A0A7Z1AGZ6_9GAMM|nr:prolyl aminopeptidase [Candidatus Thiodiazotropha endolucinida]MBT3013826.1 prolyl aminopeptidase [Candidatus Thiodiazotropha sp. (ex Lucina pensylvanica)]MBT3018008.1 prolyl aminopeptidase [Candidatus Thiodiazotropha taylori]MBT3038875.1 prolyl aminopeptidase [Candidatus Thiodiazotropha sp. (ex Codakia orbicularis)]MBV2105281.1 prolyl aminopeptidase [Candidatus Thiodiazotropha sp. (ex Lucina aurantia)]MBT3025431.1 prolyl aminopeptidase [Candidatus Thiodiazotropha taylori]